MFKTPPEIKFRFLKYIPIKKVLLAPRVSTPHEGITYLTRK